jgi:hypothetical protein
MLAVAAEAKELGRSPERVLLSTIETWFSVEFDLPGVHRHPRIELAPTAKITSLHNQTLTSISGSKVAVADEESQSNGSPDTVAIYDDATQTVYLPETWTGSTAVEQSILVHEMVHHVQNLLGIKYQCPQQREKLAYLAQDRWLALSGRSLAMDFGLDPFSLLVRTTCPLYN